MITFEGIQENLTFITVETHKQVETTLKFLLGHEDTGHSRMLARDDYIDNLKVTIENQCYGRMHGSSEISRQEQNDIRAMHIIGVNMERIADHSLSIIGQTAYLSDLEFISAFGFRPMFERVLWGMVRVRECMRTKDLSEALGICKVEHEVDELYKKNFDIAMQGLRLGKDIEDYITALFILKYIERMGDAVLNIGEALIFSIIGERIKIQQFDSIKQDFARSGLSTDGENLGVKSFWGTRSGCRISKVDKLSHQPDPGQPQEIIFKEGVASKILAERDSLELWGAMFPGLVPRVISCQQREGSASMLLEFIPGYTLDEIFLNSSSDAIQMALSAFEAKLLEVWAKTQGHGPVRTDYMGQMAQRLQSILEVHPEFSREQCVLGHSTVESSQSLFEQCSLLEQLLPAPFTVRIHGDCNVSNVLYDFEAGEVHFIDLYRSRQFDYVQDAAIFLVSNFRLPVFDRTMRDKLNMVIEGFYKFTQGYAQQQKDETFALRMVLALARSFYTSTRFELNKKFAKEMFLRAHYLMDKAAQHAQGGGSPADFKVPEAVLYY